MYTSTFNTHKRWVVGVDLGQANDYTAITVIEQRADVVKGPEGRKETPILAVRHLQRLKLNTSYPDVVDFLGRMMREINPTGPPPKLIVDATGVGRPVVDLLKKAGLNPVGVTITGGKDETTAGDQKYNIPKRNLVSALVVAFQASQLKIAAELPFAEVLRTELVNFKAKISTSGNEGFEAWREGIHDDLVLSTAIAVWWCQSGHFGLRHAHSNHMSR